MDLIVIAAKSFAGPLLGVALLSAVVGSGVGIYRLAQRRGGYGPLALAAIVAVWIVGGILVAVMTEGDDRPAIESDAEFCSATALDPC